MRRKVVLIDEDKCNGCGLCVPSCAEGAIEIVDGKARLSSEALCDGLGACLGECPLGAITIEEREAAAYDPIAVVNSLMSAGAPPDERRLGQGQDHGQDECARAAEDRPTTKEASTAGEDLMGRGCPGSTTRDFRNQPGRQASAVGGPAASELRQWPVQLRLVSPRAPFFHGADLVVSADCVPFAYGDYHRRFLNGKALVVFCPKLDADLESYVDKLAEIVRHNDLRSITVLRMAVPCCGGAVSVTEEAVRRSGKNVILKEYTISLQGEII